MPQQHSLPASLIRSHAGTAVVLAVVFTCASARSQTGNIIVTPRTIFLAGTPSAILDMAGAGILDLSVTMRDRYGVVTAKDTFAVLIPSTVGIHVSDT
jgi:hypothetical protein